MTKAEQERLSYFSIIIPAHNEEKYIGATIKAIIENDYPREKFEVIIVGNGSVDKTNEIICELAPPWFKVVFIKEKGVSKAKNRGIDLANPQGDWVIFLDADTRIKNGFLYELSNYLRKRKKKNLGSGFVSLKPYPDSLLARLWFGFYNFANHVTKTSRSIQIVRRDLLKKYRFDEELSFGEDTLMHRNCQREARYFYLKTDKVYTSTRRFDHNGWIGQLIQWVKYYFSPYEKQKLIDYEVTR